MQTLPVVSRAIDSVRNLGIGAIITITLIVLGVLLFNGVFFYAEPGFQYHVRTITGSEKVVNDTGFNTKLFGRVTEWKKALTVQSVLDLDDGGGDESVIATISAFNVVFLGNVDARIESTARFRLPTDTETFLNLAREYRTPENFVATALVPAMKDTLQSTASLMTADEFYSGGRSRFSTDFENQLANGLYVVERKESCSRVPEAALPQQSAIAQQGADQGVYGDQNRVLYTVAPVLGPDGKPLVKKPKYHAFGVELIEARITNVTPNAAFQERMKKVQEASAALAVAKQERLKEEEQKLLVQTRGEREQEEQRQAALKDQAVQTTSAETTKQLAIVAAEQRKAQADLDRQTAELLLQKAELDAKAKKTQADADAYARSSAINADNGLQQKLDAWVEINRVWAEATRTAPVPNVVLSGGDKNGTGRAGELSSFMEIMAVNAARQLDADTRVDKSR
jgi:regulator of protease activity HflC (stomatin/prohibitin superfamily)